jgi:hypothetical protein
VLNSTGKYWVKLHFMGKPRKIEIDDLMPVSATSQSLIPRTIHRAEIWPLILTKAVLKLVSHRWKPGVSLSYEMNDGIVIHALTGYVSMTLPISRLDEGTRHRHRIGRVNV